MLPPSALFMVDSFPLGFNLSNGVTWVQVNTDLFRDMQKYLYTEKWLDAILDQMVD